MKKAILNVITLSITLLLLAACSANPSQVTPAPVSSTPAVVTAEGQLLPILYLDQTFDRSGKVAEILVKDGDVVAVDQVLAILEPSTDATLALARAKQELLAAEQALTKLNDESDPDKDLVALAQARTDSANAALVSAETLVGTSDLRASTSGTIVDLELQVGQVVTPTTKIAAIADFSSWIVKTNNLTESDIVAVQVGQPVEIVLDAIPELTLKGTVTHINNRFEEVRGDVTYTVTIKLDETDPRMRWGMTAAVRFLQ